MIAEAVRDGQSRSGHNRAICLVTVEDDAVR
jgi:hypothetical protein